MPWATPEINLLDATVSTTTDSCYWFPIKWTIRSRRGYWSAKDIVSLLRVIWAKP